MPKALDFMWVYGEPLEGFNTQKLTCKLCGKVMTGGISRLKYHLAQIVGHEVGICEQATPKNVQIANKSLHDMNIKRYVRASVRTKMGRSRTGSESFTSVAPSSSTMPSSASTYYVPRTTPGAKLSIRSMVKVKEKDEVDKLVGRCFFMELHSF